MDWFLSYTYISSAQDSQQQNWQLDNSSEKGQWIICAILITIISVHSSSFENHLSASWLMWFGDGTGRCGLREQTPTRKQQRFNIAWELLLSKDSNDSSFHYHYRDMHGMVASHTWSAQISREMGCLITKSDGSTQIQLWLLKFMDISNGKAGDSLNVQKNSNYLTNKKVR